MFRSTIVLISLFTCIICWAQPRTRTHIQGVVSDAITGEPLAGASLVLSDTKTGTITDSSGYYLLQNIPAGHTIIEITYYGYQTMVVHLDITGNLEKNFSLTPTILVNEGITITGVAGATSMRKAPVSVSRVNKATLLATPSTNIIDALARQPGVNQLSTGPAVSKPVIRGLGYNRLVVINDGIRQEGQQWGDEHGIEIDENSVSRVEILKGPASIIYGSDAIAGVINIITTAPVPDRTIKGNIISGYQTNNRQRLIYGNIAGNNNGFNWNAWGDYKAAGDYKNRYDGRVYNSKYNERNFGGYAGYNGGWGFTHFIVSNFNQKLGMIEGERDSLGRFIKPLPGGSFVNPTEDDLNSTDPQLPYQHVRHLKLISDNSFRTPGGRITFNTGWQRNQRMEFGEIDDPSQESLYFDLKTYNYNAAYHFDHRQGWNTSIGLNGMWQQNKNRGIEVLIPEYGLFDIGGFVYAQKSLGSSTLSGGLRYDFRSLNSDEFREGSEIKFAGFKRTFYNLSGSIGLSYPASDYLVWKINFARGFRTPSIPELSSNGTHEGTNRYEYGDRSLISEIAWQGDLGFEVNSEHILFTANAFYNHINNFIFYRKLFNHLGQDSLVDVDGELIPAYIFNQQTAALYGTELLVDIHPHPFDWLHWENTFAFVRGRFSEAIEGDRDVPFIPAAKWTSELRGELLQKGKIFQNLIAQFYLQHNFEQDHFFSSYDTETSTASYTLLNAALSTSVMAKEKVLFSIYFNAVNLTDVAYQNHLSRLKYAAINPVTNRQGVFGMGRNFSVKIVVPVGGRLKVKSEK